MAVKKLRVGVWVPKSHDPRNGGGFSYFARLADEMSRYSFTDAEIVFISFDLDQKNLLYPNQYTLRSRVNYNLPEKVFKKLKRDPGGTIRQKQQALKEELNGVVDIIYYPVPTFALDGEAIDNFPYICTLWDLSHISTYTFPELSMNGVYEYRKPHLDKFVHKALKIFTESEAGRSEAVKYLGLNEKKVAVVPLFPSDIVLDSYTLKKPEAISDQAFFIHYPAQFWAHKNHYNLIQAFVEISRAFPGIKLVFSGADKGNKKYIFDQIAASELQNSVIDLGFIQNEELKWLYKNSAGLVMPTFLGPTNMPVVEAAVLGCPVACSDFAGHREQLGDYAWYFDPLSPRSIADTVIEMLRESKNNRRHFQTGAFTVSNALLQLDKAFSEIRSIRFCWGSFDEIY